MTPKVHSEWFQHATVDDTDSSRAAFVKVEQLLTGLQPLAMDRVQSTAVSSAAGIEIVIRHVSDPELTIDLNYAADGGGMMHVGGYDEYYRLRGEPPVEQDALDDLTTILTSTYVITDTWWKGRVIRTVVTVHNAKGEDGGITVSGWLLPPRWILPRRQLTTQSRTVSYGCTPAAGATQT